MSDTSRPRRSHAPAHAYRTRSRRLLAAFASVLHRPDLSDLPLPGAGLGAVPGAAHPHGGGPGGLGRGGRAAYLGRSTAFSARAQWSLDARGAGGVRTSAARGCRPSSRWSCWATTRWRASTGKGVALASMHHDPLLSHRPQAVLQLRARVGRPGAVGAAARSARGAPPKGVAMPAAVPALRRQPAGQRAADAPAAPRAGTSGPRYRRAPRRPSLPAGAAAHQAASWRVRAIAVVARLGGRVGAPGAPSTSSATPPTPTAPRWKGRPANVEVVGRLRLDAALCRAPAPARGRGRGAAPASAASACPRPQRHGRCSHPRGTWHRLRLVLYGRPVTPARLPRHRPVVRRPARAAVRFVVVRDPSGRRARRGLLLHRG